MGCGNLLSGPNSNHRLETTIYRPLARGRQKGVSLVCSAFFFAENKSEEIGANRNKFLKTRNANWNK